MLTDGAHKPGSVKMGYYALRSLFTNIYHKEWAKEYLLTPKVAKTLPLVLSKGEVADVLGAIDNFKHRTIIMLIYSTGARVSESANLKLTDIDSKRMQVNIQGRQRAETAESTALARIAGCFCASITGEYKPQYYLFEGAGGKGTHLGITAVRTSGKTRYGMGWNPGMHPQLPPSQLPGMQKREAAFCRNCM